MRAWLRAVAVPFLEVGSESIPLLAFGAITWFFADGEAWKESVVSFAAVMAYLDAARLRRQLAAVTLQLNATTLAVNGIGRAVDRAGGRGGGS